MKLVCCENCDGSGKVIEPVTFPTEQWPDWYGGGFVYIDCPNCEGTGLFPSNPIYCIKCGGELVLA